MQTETRCFAHHHQTAAEHGFWNVARALSHDSGILYFNGERFAKRFGSMSKTTAYALADRLIESGWFKVIKKSQRKQNGAFSPTQYRVLAHEEWVAEHPGRCDKPLQNLGMDDDEPFLESEPTVPRIRTNHSQILGTNLCKPTYVNQPRTQFDNQEPVRNLGMAGFECQGKKKRGQSASANAPTVEGPPFLKSGQVVRDSQTEAEIVANAISNTLQLRQSDQRGTWIDGVKTLLDKGHSPEQITAVAEFVHTRFKPGTMQHGGASEFTKHFNQILQHLENQQERERKSA